MPSNQSGHEKMKEINRIIGPKMQCKARADSEGRTILIVANYFRRPLEIHENPPELTDDQLQRIAAVLDVPRLIIDRGIDTDEVWGLIIDPLPTLILIPAD
ncbi:MAG: hypothetical protein V1738_00410 [Patescibacteria group bacterium]